MEEKPSLSCLEATTSVILPGGIDKEGRPIFLVTVPTDTTSLEITTPLKYLLSIFSKSSKRAGFTVLLDARKGSWRLSRSCIRQTIDTFPEGELRKLVVLKPDGFWDKQRVENCTVPQKDQEVIFIPRSRLNKFVDQSQLPVELDGGLIYSHEKWIENRQKVEEFYKDAEVTIKELEELRQHVIRSKALRASQVEEAINTSYDMEEATKMFVHNATETGKELVQNIEYENRTRKLSIDHIDQTFTPQDTLDTIERIHSIVNEIREKQQEIETNWNEMEKSLVDTKDLNELKKKVVKVTNWILGPAEQLMSFNQKVGYDVASAEELRRDHETIELQCWETYGAYAELLHRINSMSESADENLVAQHKDLISQKEFMDFVCKSFAMRVEKRRNILITSLRFFRLVSEYFDKTGEVFDSLVMGTDINDFDAAAFKLDELQESQSYLESVEQEILREGEKLSDMLSMPVKDALGQEIEADYSEDIVNIHDVLDATVARKNIFSDSVELQKLTLQQITFIDRYEKDAEQAINWLGDILRVMLRDYGHVGCTVYEIQLQKDEHQAFQETAKCTYNYGCQLLNASLQLRQSCKLPIEPHSNMFHILRNNWDRTQSISQEQMTRLRVSAVFHRSIEEHCNQLRDLREAVATIPILSLAKRRLKVHQYFDDREKLMVEVGRMVRLGRLLRSRLKEPLYEEESFFTPASVANHIEDEFQKLCNNSIKNNEIAIEAISERLSEVTQLSEELDQALKSAQQDCIVFSTTSTSTSTVGEVNNNYIDLPKIDISSMDNENKPFEKVNKTDDQLRSDEEFLTASDTTLQHSRSSSYNTASECEQHFSSWWQHGKDDMRENVSKEKMVLAVGCPPEGELPLSKEVLKPSPEVPPGKIVREVTETTHIKVQQRHNLGVKSFVLTSEIVREKDSEGPITTREETVKYQTEDGKEVTHKVDKPGANFHPDDLLARINEVGVFEQDGAWSNYSSYRNVTQQTIKKFMLS
ncbi:SEC14 domain and spectrin repeat-containing protein 1-B-like [Dendroctonus ponderosae]|uniref:SEC14 domain and spectrin repeat-containing protein 1-B-like n=1 Tax=Dendroctonus ponderosae TaxID=77166 RepID=UPI0020350BED|nr:SEC14 domain and spectrin repeat-containing protein 1-B-like [Dendroctonus ponderosae]XP_048520363.1 SEC14 domain and spectrin repeat-containing protein 1-B-like [Dendroctonus ponderosae]